MKKLQYVTLINAPREKVWKSLLDDEPYREWTSAFMQGGYYEGEWKTGTTMRFLSPEKDGTVSGMIAKITDVRPHEFISMQHLGEVMKGQEASYADKFPGQKFTESYALSDKDGITEVTVILEIPDEYASMMDEMWPKALVKLKEIAERE